MQSPIALRSEKEKRAGNSSARALSGGKDLDWLFHPRSIAVVGVSPDPDNWGNTWLRNQISAGFKGKLYAVHPRGGEVFGLKIYPRLTDIPDPVDYVISSIPAHQIPQLVADCVTKGVKTLHLFTAGFTETGDTQKAELELEIVEKARRGGLRILGPNCMGLYHPKWGLTFDRTLSKRSGSVTFISQSGGNARELGWAGLARIIRFSKIISYGNGTDINESELLEYCTHDPETAIIAAYIEGVRDGRRLLRAVKEAVSRKPVIILKAGQTEAGTRAAASHTGALAGGQAVWDTLFRQTGAVPVSSISEMADMIVTFLRLRPPKGRRVAIVGGGGGASVIAADDCAKAGLILPVLEPEIQQALWRFTPLAGTSVRNPVDSFFPRSPGDFYETIKIVASSPQVDFIISHIATEFALTLPEGQKKVDGMVDALLKAGKEVDKPMAIVLRSSGAAKAVRAVSRQQRKCVREGFPVYPGIASAAQAISKFIKFYEDRSEWE